MLSIQFKIKMIEPVIERKGVLDLFLLGPLKAAMPLVSQVPMIKPAYITLKSLSGWSFSELCGKHQCLPQQYKKYDITLEAQ